MKTDVNENRCKKHYGYRYNEKTIPGESSSVLMWNKF